MAHWHRRSAPTTSALGRSLVAGFLLCCSLAASDAAWAQGGPPAGAIVADGNAIVTGFSGAVQLPGPQDSAADSPDLLFIDPNGPSARVVDLQSFGAPPQAQMLTAPKPFTVAAGQIGQVFGVALDDANPPNIFLAATSAYGLPIVVPAGEGTLLRARTGSADARFMPGLFGPAALHGGPGSIWRVDGTSGQVSLFANVTLNGTANSGPALGGLAFDPASGTLYVADRATGMIHGFDRQGRERARFDHGVQGRGAAGLNPIAYDPASRLDITSPAFNSEDLSTWSYAPPERRVFGLAVHSGRLYYSVADGLQVWSVAIAPDGSFGSDPHVEVQAVPGSAGNEISKIAFDDRGRMLIAERAPPTGAYDFAVLAQQSAGLVLRLPASPSSTAPVVQVSASAPDEYAIGFFDQLRNSTGGIAIGYNYTAAGQLDHATCGGFLWTTGDELRNSPDPQMAAQLTSAGPSNVDGLQGNSIGLVRPANVPPLKTYFVDYDDMFASDADRGHIGDLAIRRGCQPAFAPPPAPLPSGAAPVQVVPPPGIIPVPGVPLPPGGFCPRDRMTDTGRCCPPDTRPLPNGECERRPVCPPGQLTDSGRCCPPDTRPLRNGECGRPPVCPRGQLTDTGRCCPPDTRPLPDGECGRPPVCPPGQRENADHVCVCPDGEREVNGRCPPPPPRCPPGQRDNADHVCVCPGGASPRDGRCPSPPPPPTCGSGETRLLNGGCEPPPPPCPGLRDALTGRCAAVEHPPIFIPRHPRRHELPPGRHEFRPPPRERGPVLHRPLPVYPQRGPVFHRPLPPYQPRGPVFRRVSPPYLTRVPAFRRPPPPPMIRGRMFEGRPGWVR